MKLAIVGSRTFTEYQCLYEAVNSLSECHIEEIISGGARGTDSLAERYARENGIPVKVFRPDWDGQGKSAGFIRNKQIIDACTHVIAFWDGKSKGTEHSIRLAEKQGKPVKVIKF